MVQALTIVILRALAVYILMIGINSISVDLGIYTYDPTATQPATFLLASLLMFIVAAAIWFAAPALVGWFVPARFRRDGEMTVQPEDIVAAATFLIGMFWALSVLPRMITLLLLFRNDAMVTHTPILVALCVQFIVAIAMMLSVGKMTRLFKRLRTLGRDG